MSFILMKLFAFRDRTLNSADDYGAYHAFDILQTIDSMDRAEWDEARTLLGDAEATVVVAEARSIVTTLFGSARSKGSVRLIEYARTRQGVPLTLAQLELFVRELHDLFAG